MKTNITKLISQKIIFIIVLSFLYGCSVSYTRNTPSPIRSAQSLEPGQLSLGGSYTLGSSEAEYVGPLPFSKEHTVKKNRF